MLCRGGRKEDRKLHSSPWLFEVKAKTELSPDDSFWLKAVMKILKGCDNWVQPGQRSKQPSQTLWLSLNLVKKEFLGPACIWSMWYDCKEDLAVLWLSIDIEFLPKINVGRQAGTLVWFQLDLQWGTPWSHQHAHAGASMVGCSIKGSCSVMHPEQKSMLVSICTFCIPVYYLGNRQHFCCGMSSKNERSQKNL